MSAAQERTARDLFALRALRVVANAEEADQTLSGRGIGKSLGVSESKGLEARADLIALGWVEDAGRRGNATVLRVTPAGLAELQSAPQLDVRETEAMIEAPMTKTRRCLCCERNFDSAWAGNRICAPCRGTEAYRGATADSFRIILR